MIQFNAKGKQIVGKATRDGFVYAQSSNDKFYIKKCTAGVNSGHMLDPHGIWYNNGDEHRINARSGKYLYELKEVTKSVFDNYIKYLQTRNETYLRIAEREIA